VMLGGKGLYRGSSTLISGSPGTGKSTLGAYASLASCERGERCIYFAFEESAGQIVRNMRSIGLDLAPHVRSGRLRIHAARPSLFGLETRLAMMHKEVRDGAPAMVVVDPLSSLAHAGSVEDASPMILRLIDFLKGKGTTAVFTSLTHGLEAAAEW